MMNISDLHEKDKLTFHRTGKTGMACLLRRKGLAINGASALRNVGQPFPDYLAKKKTVSLIGPTVLSHLCIIYGSLQHP